MRKVIIDVHMEGDDGIKSEPITGEVLISSIANIQAFTGIDAAEALAHNLLYQAESNFHNAYRLSVRER